MLAGATCNAYEGLYMLESQGLDTRPSRIAKYLDGLQGWNASQRPGRAADGGRGSLALGLNDETILHRSYAGGGPRGTLRFLPFRPGADTAPQNHPVPLGLYLDPLRI